MHCFSSPAHYNHYCLSQSHSVVWCRLQQRNNLSQHHSSQSGWNTVHWKASYSQTPFCLLCNWTLKLLSSPFIKNLSLTTACVLSHYKDVNITKLEFSAKHCCGKYRPKEMLTWLETPTCLRPTGATTVCSQLVNCCLLLKIVLPLLFEWIFSMCVCVLVIFYDQFDIWLTLLDPVHHSQFHWPLVLPQEVKNLLLCHGLLMLNTSSAFVSPCSPREAAAGEGDRPEDSGGRSQWCKSHSPKISVIQLCVCERASMGVLVISCVFCVGAHGTGITRWFQLVLASVSHLQLQLCSQMLIFSSDEFQTHILLSVLLWLLLPVFVPFTSLRAVVSMARKTQQDKSPMHFPKLKRSVDHRRRATITRLSWVLSLCREPWCSCDIFIGKKLRGEQEDTQNDRDERRVNVYSFNTDKYSYVSEVRI